jgi:acyl dehydratase
MEPCPLAVGEKFERRVVFDAASIRAFASLAGDENPLHHDDTAAAASPAGRLIVSGPHISALMMGLTATWFTRRCDALGLQFDFRFVKAIPAGAALNLEWTITGTRATRALDGYVVAMDGRAVDDAGVVFTTAHGANLVRFPKRKTP